MARDRLEHTGRLNGYKPRSYGDIVAISTLLAMLISVVAWGLKLEGELNAIRDDLTEIKAAVGDGILPRAEERIRYLEAELDDHKIQDHN